MSEPRLPRRIPVERLARSAAEAQALDDAFWASMTGTQRIEAIWDMVLEWEAVHGRDGNQLRLQRSVVHIQRP